MAGFEVITDRTQRGEGEAPDDLPGSSGDRGGDPLALADRSGAAPDAGKNSREDHVRPGEHRRRSAIAPAQDTAAPPRKRRPALPLAGLQDASEVAL